VLIARQTAFTVRPRFILRDMMVAASTPASKGSE
jgi:hypothetical protein